MYSQKTFMIFMRNHTHEELLVCQTQSEDVKEDVILPWVYFHPLIYLFSRWSWSPGLYNCPCITVSVKMQTSFSGGITLKESQLNQLSLIFGDAFLFGVKSIKFPVWVSFLPTKSSLRQYPYLTLLFPEVDSLEVTPESSSLWFGDDLWFQV